MILLSRSIESLALLLFALDAIWVSSAPESTSACEKCDSDAFIHEYESVYEGRCVDNSSINRDILSQNSCSTQLRHQLVDLRSGLVAFCILVPHDTRNSKIILRALQPGTEKYVSQNCSSSVERVHSNFQMIPDVKVDPECRPDQFKEIKWKFNYLFTGWYVVEIEMKFNCSSQPFYVKSNFMNEPIARESLNMTRKFVGQHLFANFYFGIPFHHNYPNTAIVKLRSNNSYPGTRLACCITGYLTRHCYWFKEDQVLPLQCSCKWVDDYLECSFAEMPPGNYCMELEIYDSRCKRNTIWTENVTYPQDPCLWKFDNLIVKNYSGNPDPYPVPMESSSSYWPIILCVVTSVVTVCLFLYLRRRNNRNQFLPVLIPPASMELSPDKLNKTPKVFLLYARDTPPFMQAISQLRSFLRHSIGAQVYDIWDNRMKDEIDTTGGNTWALRYLHDEEVQVILVASPISVCIEQAILNDQSINYTVPDSRDDAFIFAFKTVIQMAHTHNDRCWKIIVVRINSKNCCGLVLKSFEEVLATVYTLPQHLDNLLSHLRHDLLSVSAANIQYRATFQKKIEDYETYLSSEKHCDDDLFTVLPHRLKE